VVWTVVAVVIVSIVVHGVTGAPLTRRLLGEDALLADDVLEERDRREESADVTAR
jgi:NhaP-type Na+/H+ or K+/H+ antiporter